VLARRSSTKHSTQQSALTLKYWQNISYQLGGMNRLIRGHDNFSSLVQWVTFARECGAFLPPSPPITHQATVTDRHMAGVGHRGETAARKTNTDRVIMAEFISPKIETEIASKRNSVINRYLFVKRRISRSFS